MPIIARTRRGYKNYTEYDLQNTTRLDNLKNNISQLGSKLTNSITVEEQLRYAALLKFICINLWQTAIMNTQTEVALVNDIYNRVFAILNGFIITADEWRSDPENLFNLPKYITQKSSPRKVIGYEKNETASLSYEAPKTSTLVSHNITNIKTEKIQVEKKLENIQNPKKIEIDLAKNNPRVQDVLQSENGIQEHARRRVELFFFLCVSLYNKKRQVIPGETNKQHGQAKREGFEACHSSLFPGIKDLSKDRQTRSSKDASIFFDTFIAESFNLTMELPKCVNIFDRLLEGRNTEKGTHLRQKLLPILNQVSDGIVTPLCAMNAFFIVINNFLNKNESLNQALEKETTYSPSLARKQVKLYEEKGTFYWTDNRSKLSPSIEAASCWLRVSNSTAALFMHDKTKAPKYVHNRISSTQMSFQSTLFLKYETIQKEALSVKNKQR